MIRSTQTTSGLCRTLCVLCLALMGFAGEVSAQENITLRNLDTYTRRSGGASVSLNGDKTKIVFEEHIYIFVNHLGDNWVIYTLPCIGAGDVLSFSITRLENDVLAIGDAPHIAVIQFDETFPVTENINVDNLGEGNTGRLAATAYTSTQKNISLSLSSSAKYVAICFDARNITLTSTGTVDNIKITKRQSTVTYGKTGGGDGTVSATSGGASVASGSQVYVCDDVSFTAVPNDCSEFDGWYVGATRISDQPTFTYSNLKTGNLNIQAKFNLRPAPSIECKHQTLLSTDGQVSLDLPTVQNEPVDSWTVNQGLNVVGDKITGTLPWGETQVSVTALRCSHEVSCISRIVVIKRLSACETD